jgi:hypothetical protein
MIMAACVGFFSLSADFPEFPDDEHAAVSVVKQIAKISSAQIFDFLTVTLSFA